MPAPVQDWLSRVRRLPAVGDLALGPLTRDGTAEQMALLTGAAPDAGVGRQDLRRTAGRRCSPSNWPRRPTAVPCPAARGAPRPPPRRPLDEPAWRVARALGVRGPGALETAAGRRHRARRRRPGVGTARARRERHLLRTGRGTGSSWGTHCWRRPPRGCARPETADEHRRIASSLGRPPRSRGRRGRRALAARGGHRRGDRLADPGSAAGRRGAVRLRPGGGAVATSPRPLAGRRGGRRVAGGAHGSTRTSRRWTRWATPTSRPPGTWPRRACATPRMAADADVAAIYTRAARHQGTAGRPRRWVGPRRPGDRPARIDRALGRLRPRPPLYARCCWTPSGDTTRPGPPRQTPLRHAPTSTRPSSSRKILIEHAYCDASVGDLNGGLASLDAAARVQLTTPDPEGDIQLAVTRTHLLMMAGQGR